MSSKLKSSLPALWYPNYLSDPPLVERLLHPASALHASFSVPLFLGALVPFLSVPPIQAFTSVLHPQLFITSGWPIVPKIISLSIREFSVACNNPYGVIFFFSPSKSFNEYSKRYGFYRGAGCSGAINYARLA